MEITKGVHLLEVTKGSYAYLILGDEPTLVDTGMASKGPKVVAALERLGITQNDLAHIVLTHHDVDHIGNVKRLQEWSGATVWAPEIEIPYIHGEKKDSGFRRLIATMMRVDRPTKIRAYETGFQIGDLEVIPAPGHTHGHVCLRKDGVLLAGDLVTTRNGKLCPAPGFLTTDKEALKQSIRSVGKLQFDWVCPAHGDPVQRGNLWEALER